jgi:decaprenylphospho-beta-D-erythro-pentofuranosid-2-ulose 2-reductase
MLNGLGEFQRILVLGGKSQIAESIMIQLPIARDAKIILCGRNLINDSKATSLISHQTQELEIDFSNIELAIDLVDSVFKVSDIDLVIFAFGVLGDELNQLNRDVLKEVLSVNLFSQAQLLGVVYKNLAVQMYGQILYISSVAAIRPRRRNFVYGASKAGVDFIARGLQKLSEESNVFITILRSGFVHTKMTAGLSVAPFATNRDAVAKIAVSGLIRKKKIVYAPRILVLVMFVLRLLPERIFRILDK